MDLEKIQGQKNSLESELKELQGQLNQIKLTILTKKNQENYVKTGYLKQSVDDYKKKIGEFAGIHSQIEEMQKEEIEKKEKIVQIQSRCKNVDTEIEEIEEMIKKKLQEKKQAWLKGKNLTVELENSKKVLKEEQNQKVFTEVQVKKAEVQRLLKELEEITRNRLDPAFLLQKSEKQKEKLQEKLEDLKEYFDKNLVSEMKFAIPQKEIEKSHLQAEFHRQKEEKEVLHEEIKGISKGIKQLDEEYFNKKLTVKEMQENINEIEDEVDLLSIDNEKYHRLEELLKKGSDFEIIEKNELEKLTHSIEELEKTIATKESNYKNGIRSVSSRIFQINSFNGEMRAQITNLLSKIFKKS